MDYHSMMAKLIRTSKSGNKWTPDDLLAYNIRVVHQDATTFFGVPVLSLPKNVDEEVLTAEDAAATQRSYALLRTMELAMSTAYDQESAVCDCIVELLHTLKYNGT